MFDLANFFVKFFRAFLGRPFVADPDSWMTRANELYAQEQGIRMAQSACPYFWRAVWLRPAAKVTHTDHIVLSNNSQFLAGLWVATTIGLSLIAGEVGILPVVTALLILMCYGFVRFLERFGTRVEQIIMSTLALIGIVLALFNVAMALGLVIVLVLAVVIVFTVFGLATQYFCPTVFYPEKGKDKN